MHIYGKSDGFFTYDDSFKPWKKLIGTKAEDLQVIELDDVGHGIPKDIVIKNQSIIYEAYSFG